MIKFSLADHSSGKASEVDSHGGHVTVNAGHPPFAAHHHRTEIFRGFLVDSAGSSDMSVDGSSTNVEFFVRSDIKKNRYITQLSFEVAYGTSGQPNEWADGTALTNGTELFYTSERGDIFIHDAIKTNEDLFRLQLGAIPTAWEVRHLGASNDFGYIMTLNLKDIIPPYGISLVADSEEVLCARVRDNVATDADTFNIIAYGFDRF